MSDSYSNPETLPPPGRTAAPPRPVHREEPHTQDTERDCHFPKTLGENLALWGYPMAVTLHSGESSPGGSVPDNVSRGHGGEGFLSSKH